MRILIAGDTHANRSHLSYLFDVAEEQEASRIFVVGDFGYWPRWAGGQRFIKTAEELTALSGIELYWLDGNHEDHVAMKQFIPNALGFVRVRHPYSTSWPNSKVFYAPRGHVWEWDGIRFMSMGGAYSVDKDMRIEGEDWFSEEEITDRDVARAIQHVDGKPIDVMLTHDTPGVTELLEMELWRIGRGYKLDPNAMPNRIQLDKVVQAAKPAQLFHGHYHLNYSEVLDDEWNDFTTKIQGLDRDDSGKESWTVFDTQAPAEYEWPESDVVVPLATEEF